LSKTIIHPSSIRKDKGFSIVTEHLRQGRGGELAGDHFPASLNIYNIQYEDEVEAVMSATSCDPAVVAERKTTNQTSRRRVSAPWQTSTPPPSSSSRLHRLWHCFDRRNPTAPTLDSRILSFFYSFFLYTSSIPSFYIHFHF
jgi:hypothetical protein